MAEKAGLVGRADELALLAACLREATEGHGALVMVAGEAGVGKTKLLSELAEWARHGGAAVAWGRCREDGGAPPFHPWVQVLGGVVEAVDLPLDEIGRQWPDVASMLKAVPVADLRHGHPSDRFRLFVSVGSLLAHCAARALVVIVIDDLHRADEASLGLLRFLAPDLARLRLLVVAAYRDSDVGADHPLKATVAQLADGPGPVSVHLGGLDADGVAELLGRHAGPVPTDVVETVTARTSGNPLFVIELARLLRSSQSDKTQLARLAVPPTVQDAVGQRVRRLPLDTQRALEAAAVLGREFGRLPLSDLLGASAISVTAALQPAATARLISSGPDGYRFTHAIVQAAVYEALPVERRTQLHRKARDALTGLDACDDERISDLAFHSYRAAVDGDVGPGRRHTLAAARRARQRLAFEDAARWYALSLELAERDRASPPEVLELLFESAEAEIGAGQVPSARAGYERAADIARALQNAGALTRAALGVGSTVVTAGRVDWELVRLLEEAAAASVSGSDLARLESRLAIELYWHQEGEPSRSQSAKALQTAERSGDPAALGVALHARQFTLRSPEHLDERIEIGRRLVDLAQAADDEELAFQGTVWLAADVMREGDLASFRRLVESLVAGAARSRLPLRRWYATVMRAELAAIEGQVDHAYELTESAGSLGSRLGLDVAAAYRLGQLFVLCRERQGLAELVADIEDVGARLPYFVTVRGFAALTAASTGHRDTAAWEIDRLSGDGFAPIPRDSLWVATIALLAEAAAICASSHTRQLADLLTPHQGTFVVQGIPNCFGSVDRFLGRAATALGEWDAANRFLARALEMENRIAAPLFVARTTLDRARLAVSTGRRDEARRLVMDVQATATRLGLGTLSDEAAQVLYAGCGHYSGLSKREREVLALLSAGASNKDIAAGLVVSLNTVERHLANIYTKLGVRGRAEAAAYAVRSGLDAGNGGLP